jgi:hypothetical protein
MNFQLNYEILSKDIKRETLISLRKQKAREFNLLGLQRMPRLPGPQLYQWKVSVQSVNVLSVCGEGKAMRLDKLLQ